MKLWLIHLFDWFDDRILRHSIYWVCQKIELSSWWGEEDCLCSYCIRYRQKWSELQGEDERKN